MTLRYWRNERGGTLVYVLFAFSILLVFAPVMLNLVMDKTLTDKTNQNQKLVEQMALTGLETFVGYLNGYSSQTGRSGHFKSYTGWTNETWITVTLPENQPVSYRQRLCEDSSCSIVVPSSSTLSKTVYYAEFTAIAGDMDGDHVKDVGSEPLFREKRIVYSINVADGGPAPSDIIPDERIIAISDNIMLVGGIETDGTNPQEYGFTNNNLIENLIKDEMTYQVNSANTLIDSYVSKMVSCEAARNVSACTVSDIDALMASSSTSPVIIHVNSLNLTKNKTLQYSKPIVLLVDNLSMDNADLTVYGDLVVLKSTTFNHQIGLSAKSVDGKYGNLLLSPVKATSPKLTYNTIQTDTQSDFYADGTLFSGGDITCKNNCTFQADQTAKSEIIIQGKLTVETQVNLMSKDNVLLGAFLAKNNATITATAGDLFVQGDFIAETKPSVTTAGVIAVGGNVQLKNSGTFDAGTNTSLHLPGVTMPASGGGSGTTVNWSPTRQ